MNRVPCEQTAPGSKVCHSIKWVYCCEDPGATINLKGKQQEEIPSLNCSYFETSFGEPVWRLDTCIYSLLIPLCTKFSLKDPLLSPQNAGLHSSAATAVPQPSATTYCYCSPEGKTALRGCLSTEENIWHREWPWLITFKELLNPAQQVTQMIS